MFVSYNANPCAARVGDCTVRAISKALGKTWEQVYVDLCLLGLQMCDMPSANAVWGEYLMRNGYSRHLCPFGQTVEQFAKDHQSGTFIMAISGHVVPVINGQYFDTWNSGNEVPVYYWRKNQ